MINRLPPTLVQVPPEGSLGRAMRALPNDNQRGFVIALLEHGDGNATRAAITAGFVGSPATLRVTAHRLMHDDLVQAAMDEEAARRLNSGKIMAVSVLLTLAGTAAKDSDKLKAIEMLLNRTGMPGQSEHKVIVSDVSKTDEEMIARITYLAKKRGLDPQLLIGGPVPDTVDAEFEEVEAEPEVEDW